MVYKEGIINGIESNIPDIVIIRETLPGNSNILSIIDDIRARFQDIRIVFLAGNREPGDAFLSALVNYGIYDILYGESLPAKEIIELIKNKNTYSDVKHLQPIPLLDMDSNKVLFDASEQKKEKATEVNSDTDNDSDKEDIPNKESIKEPKVLNIGKSKEKAKELKERFKLPQIPKINFKKEEEIKENPSSSNDSEKIITFVGGKNGVGTSSIAINFAFMLAGEGKNVIYVEFNEKYPSVSYWYELGIVDEGIDTFINYLNNNEFHKIKNTIVKTSEIKTKESSMKENYKAFPNSLDFLFFSKEYLSGAKDKINKKNIKELYLYLLYQLGYDYVILDVPSDIHNEATKDALMFSNKVFPVITQDVSSIGYLLFNINLLSKMGIDIKNKTTYILNKYDNETNFNSDKINNWVEIGDIVTIPLLSNDFIDSNLMGIPLYLREISQSFNKDIIKIKKYL